MIATINSLWEEYGKNKAGNKARHCAFEKIVNDLDDCNDKKALLAITKAAGRYNINYPYSHFPRKANYSVFLIFYLIICYFLMLYIYMFLIAVGIVSFVIYKLSERIDDLCVKWVSNAIYTRKLEIEYKIYNIAKEERDKKLGDWQKIFMLFNHGDKDLYLNYVGHIKLIDNTDAQFFDFEYKTVFTSGAGNDKSTTVINHQHYGFIFPFNSDDIAIFSTGLTHKYNESWKTESKKFNLIYRSSAKNQNKVVKFLSPTVINLFLDISDLLNNCNFEVSNGLACLSFEDRDFLVSRMKNTLSTF